MENSKEISKNGSIVSSGTIDRIDEFEKYVVDNLPPYQPKINHYFAPGIYIREMIAIKGANISSKVHKTEHFFEVSLGRIKTWDEFGGEIEIVAPYRGLTKAGTHRAAEVLQDCMWATVHAIPFITGEERNWSEEEIQKLVDKIEEIVIEPRKNLLLKEPDEFKKRID